MKISYKLLSLFCCSFQILSCVQDDSFSKKEYIPKFKISNISKGIVSLQIAVCDMDNNKGENDIVFINRVFSVKDSFEFSQDLRDISKTGNGYFKIMALKKERKDTLYQKFGSYSKYNFSNDSFPGYDTFEVVVADSNQLLAPYDKKELKISFVKQ